MFNYFWPSEAQQAELVNSREISPQTSLYTTHCHPSCHQVVLGGSDADNSVSRRVYDRVKEEAGCQAHT